MPISREKVIKIIKESTNFKTLKEAKEKGFLLEFQGSIKGYAVQVDTPSFEWVEYILHKDEYYGW